jgi:hypothetical protein
MSTETRPRRLPFRDRPTLSDDDLHHILRNSRRRAALHYLGTSWGPTTVRDLSEVVAARETGERPPPRDVREAVYISLHQNHLPTLAEHDIVEYDRDRKEVVPRKGAAAVGRHLAAISGTGVTWDEYYRLLGILALTLVACSAAGLPLVSAVPVAGWAVGFLATFALSTVYQLVRYRGLLLAPLVG